MKGFFIGHDHNERTGVSVILAPSGAVGGVSVRGGAPGTRETDLLKSENMIERIHAVVLSGGSAFGLESACGVMRYLYESGHGFNAGTQLVPIVPAAVLYDLGAGELVYPTAQMGYNAANSATQGNLSCGRIGAGRGATVGKIRAPLGVDGGGLGVAVCECGQLFVGAMVAVNALGDVLDYQSSKIIAGARCEDGSFLNSNRAILSMSGMASQGANTTIGVVFTNAKVTKPQANKLADSVHDAYAKCISPAHTMYDGDTVFSMASGEVDADINSLMVLGVEAMCRAIKRAVLL